MFKAEVDQIRSLERLKACEAEIEKNYNKYINEYGLLKTAFPHAINQLKEKAETARVVS